MMSSAVEEISCTTPSIDRFKSGTRNLRPTFADGSHLDNGWGAFSLEVLGFRSVFKSRSDVFQLFPLEITTEFLVIRMALASHMPKVTGSKRLTASQGFPSHGAAT